MRYYTVHVSEPTSKAWLVHPNDHKIGSIDHIDEGYFPSAIWMRRQPIVMSSYVVVACFDWSEVYWLKTNNSFRISRLQMAIMYRHCDTINDACHHSVNIYTPQESKTTSKWDISFSVLMQNETVCCVKSLDLTKDHHSCVLPTRKSHSGGFMYLSPLHLTFPCLRIVGKRPHSDDKEIT
jgi:hypothetical protein